MSDLEPRHEQWDDEFFNRIKKAYQSKFGVELVCPGDLGRWAVASAIQLDRGTFSFKRHEYLREPYQDNHPRQVEMKCTQMGGTIRALLRAFYLALFKPVVGVMYLFPSRVGSGEFTRSRVDPLISWNPETLGQYIQDTDNVSLKRIRGRNLLFRGSKSKEGLRSDPVDAVFFDEFDLFQPQPEAVQTAARGRMAHSDLKIEHYLSNPTLPDQGIDLLWQMSDQRFWLLKCEKCGKYTCLEDTFPECLIWSGEDVLRVCMSCRDSILHPAHGIWVAKNPSIQDWRGYHYSHLFNQFEDPKDILTRWEGLSKASEREGFHNFVLGFPYIEAENRLSIEGVLGLCGGEPNASTDRGPCVIGIDQGLNLHVVVMKLHPDRVVHIGVYKDWEDLDRLMADFKVVSGVVDAQPERRLSQAFADRFPGKVWINFYTEHGKEGYVWNDESRIVTSNRTHSMDESHSILATGRVVLPRRGAVVEEFAMHCHAVARKLEEGRDGGKRYRYVKLKGEDHFRHAFNYACIARSRIVNSFLGGCDLG